MIVRFSNTDVCCLAREPPGQEVCGPPTQVPTKDTGLDRQDSTTHCLTSPPQQRHAQPSPPPPSSTRRPSSGPPRQPSGQAHRQHCPLCSGLTRFYSVGNKFHENK